MKTGKLFPYMLVGGGLFFFLSRGKKKVPADLSAAAQASNAAIRAVSAAAKPHQAASAAREEALVQLRELKAELSSSAVKGIGEVQLLPPSDRMAPFSKTNPPHAYQFAVIYSISPDLAKFVTPEELWPTYAKGIIKNPTLLKLAEETNLEAKIMNVLSLLTPNRQRMFAAKCAFRAAQIFGSEAFHGTDAKKLALDTINTIRARADKKITAAQMDALNKPRLKKLRQISSVVGKPQSAELAIEALEKASITSTVATTAEEKRISHYLDMLMSVEKSKGAYQAAQRELAQKAPTLPKKAPPGKFVPSARKSAAEAAEAADTAARNAGRKFDTEFLEKLLKDI